MSARVDATVHVQRGEVATLDARPEAAGQQRVYEHVRQHRVRNGGVVGHLAARRRTLALRYIAHVLCATNSSFDNII